MGKAKGLLIVITVLTVFTSTVMAMPSRQLSPEDCRVMEIYLKHQGHRVVVESGALVITGNQVEAKLQCRSGALTFEWAYPLGELGRREALEKRRR